MTKARIAVGTGAAILVVGAVVHLKPSSRLTSESFVSAVFTNTPGIGVTGTQTEIDKLPACGVLTVSLTTAATTALAPETLHDTNYGATANTFYVTDKACICGKFSLTRGRICEASGNANPKGQSYLPRCPPVGTNIPESYSSGCWCGADADFTSANTNLALGPDVTVVATALANTNVAAATQICIADIVCLKGETCETGPQCDSGGTKYKRRVQKYAWMLPKIAPNADDKKFKICKSTALQKQQCDSTTGTAQTGNVPLCKDV